MRIYKVLSYYEDYWNLMKHYGEDIDNSMVAATGQNRVSNFMGREEQRRLDKARQWREKHLLRMIVLYITLPLLAFSLIAYTIPYVYTLVPVYESESCWNQFLRVE